MYPNNDTSLALRIDIVHTYITSLYKLFLIVTILLFLFFKLFLRSNDCDNFFLFILIVRHGFVVVKILKWKGCEILGQSNKQ